MALGSKLAELARRHGPWLIARLHTLPLVSLGSELARCLRFLGPRSVVRARSVVLGRLVRCAMADQAVAWSALETIYGSSVRGPGSQTYKIKIVRIRGLSDRLTGSSEST